MLPRYTNNTEKRRGNFTGIEGKEKSTRIFTYTAVSDGDTANVAMPAAT